MGNPYLDHEKAELLQSRNFELGKKIRERDMQVRELEDKISAMITERERIITDYDAYIDKLLEDQEKNRGLADLVRKLENEKDFLEHEIEKVRAIKMMLENQLATYSENAEIKKLRNDNARLMDDFKRFKCEVFDVLGYDQDPSRMDAQLAIKEFRTLVSSRLSYQQNSNFNPRNSNADLARLEEQIRIMKRDQAMRDAEITRLKAHINQVNNENLQLKASKTENYQNDQRELKILREENAKLNDRVKRMTEEGRNLQNSRLQEEELNSQRLQEILRLNSQMSSLQQQLNFEQQRNGAPSAGNMQTRSTTQVAHRQS